VLEDHLSRSELFAGDYDLEPDPANAQLGAGRSIYG
jgi:hypothetical protein